MYTITKVTYIPSVKKRPLYVSQRKSYASKLIIHYKDENAKTYEKNIIEDFHNLVGNALQGRIEQLQSAVPYKVSDFSESELKRWFISANLSVKN